MFSLTGLFQNREEAVAAVCAAQKRQSPVAGTGDKVQVMSAVGAMQAAGHDKQHGTGRIVPALANNARTGHPSVPEREETTESWATRRRRCLRLGVDGTGNYIAYGRTLRQY
jgi:hypothetical protein